MLCSCPKLHCMNCSGNRDQTISKDLGFFNWNQRDTANNT